MTVIDYSYTHPSLNRLNSLGATGVVRYVSSTSSKNLSKSEYSWLKKNGFGVALVWEDSAGAAKKGYDQGKKDALRANAQADDLGYPRTAGIYYAVDFDDTSSDLDEVRNYFRGVAAAKGRDYGVYGSYSVVENVTADYYWQTSAWSGGKRSSRCDLYQHLYYNDVDVNAVYSVNWGQDSAKVKPKPPTTHPAFPLAAGDYFGDNGVTSGHNLDDWQRQMSKRGWTLTADGSYGPATKSVATAFQKEKGLQVDGLIGKETWDAAWTAPVT